MNSAAIAARISEFLTGSEIRSQTGADFSPCARPTAESPRSPCSSPVTQSMYSWYAGLSRPICAFSVETFSGVALRPRTTLAASPGSSTVPAKITIDATNSARMAPTIRRPRNRSTGENSRAPTPRSAVVVVM